MRNVLLADNQDISKTGLESILKDFVNSELILYCNNKKELISTLIQYQDAMVVLDYNLFDFDSSTELLNVLQRFDRTNWVLFSDVLTDDFIKTILYNSESVSIILKDSSKDEIIHCLKDTLKGVRHVCSQVSNILININKFSNTKENKPVLTLTEQEILKEMALGKSTKDIATKRFVSIHTIMTHRKNIFKKIQVNNVHEATKYAMRAGIIELAEYYI